VELSAQARAQDINERDSELEPPKLFCYFFGYKKVSLLCRFHNSNSSYDYEQGLRLKTHTPAEAGGLWIN
jgi:hypothetical protein